MTLLRDSREDFGALIGAASDSLEIPVEFIEKDYWVTEVLRSIARPYPSVTPIFKGGTSLSKVFRVIDRMSEDVDILLDVENGVSKQARERILEGLTQRVVADLPVRAEPKAATKTVKRNTRFYYPAVAAPTILTSGVLLEMGVRGGAHPRQSHEVSSYIVEYAEKGRIDLSEFDDCRRFELSVLRPERTILEKMAGLHHHASSLPDERAAKALQIGARHYYDIAKCLEREDLQEGLAALGDIAKFSAQIDQESRRWEFGATSRPVGGYAESPAFDGNLAVREIVERGYARAMSLVLPGRQKPSLNECLDIIKRHRAII